MYYYIFEDNPDSMTALLLKAGYTDSSHIIFTKGNSAIKKTVESLMLNEENKVIIYLDMVPGNYEIRKIYFSLTHLEHIGARIMVLPIVCSEYLFIKSLPGSFLFKDNLAYLDCVGKINYLNTVRRWRINYSDFITFERFCKKLLRECALDCVTTSSVNSDNTQNVLYRHYITNSCVCDTSVNDCVNITLKDKTFRYLKELPCIPGSSVFNITKSLSWDELYELHCRLVDEFNNWVTILHNNVERIEVLNRLKHISKIIRED